LGRNLKRQKFTRREGLLTTHNNQPSENLNHHLALIWNNRGGSCDYTA
jgi:hypothetical protein